ncbi:hypothetical protein NESM_000741700 [Novymonas esmeraldas]|uniref:Uncharacterized protein n=1 Tax=Novymonas esmeraldas TaxID=1808958 RepID=A0AAW0EUE5_9TRYP
MPSSPVVAQAAPDTGRRRGTATATGGPAPAPPPSFDFHTVTCVTWSSSGRNIGVGTADGFLIYSTEPLISVLRGSRDSQHPPVASADPGGPLAADSDHTPVQEVCRCAVYGGVGLLSLYKQCSIVAFTGVQRRSAAARVQLADVSQPAPSSLYELSAPPLPMASNRTDRVATPSSRCKPWPPEEDAAAAQWYERWRVSVFANSASAAATTLTTLAFVECPPTVVGLQFCPHVVIAAASGDPKIAGSHRLHIFDHRLHPLYTLPVYPPSSNAFLRDMIAIAATPTLSNGAGMEVQRLRVLLPGERKGEVRLLTFKKSTLTATPLEVDTQGASVYRQGSGDAHRMVDQVLHQAPLRAVAITEDGRSGVTMSEQGMRIRVLDFVGDDKIAVRLSLDRGHLPAVVDTVSLAIAAMPHTHASLRHTTTAAAAYAHERCGSNEIHGASSAHATEPPGLLYQRLTEAVHDIVVCLTSSGTIHVFGCGLQQVLFYHSDKTLLPRVGYPYAFSVCLPCALVKDDVAALFVTRSDVSTSAAHYLPHHERATAALVHGGRRASGQHNSGGGAASSLPGEFFSFQLRYHTSSAAADVTGETCGPSKCTMVACCRLSAP